MSYARKIVLTALAGALLATGLSGWKWGGKSITPESGKASPIANVNAPAPQPDGWSWGGGSDE
jgi:hypothetical protein